LRNQAQVVEEIPPGMGRLAGEAEVALFADFFFLILARYRWSGGLDG